MITPATFRADLPEFANTTVYPDLMIAYWIAIGVLMLPTQSWGLGSTTAVSPPSTIYDFGLEMFVAHNCALEAQAIAAAAAGGVPGGGGATGNVTSESVGQVSRGYSDGSSMLPDAGHWNLTVYGNRFLFLARLRGKGPIQIGPPQGGFGAGAWYGPPVFPPYWNT